MSSSNWTGGLTDWEVAQEIINNLLQWLKQEKEEEITILDDCSCDDLYPCPRYIPKKEHINK